MNAQPAEAVFSRHLDLAVLRGRRQGLVTCIFHRGDTDPSLSMDIDRGLFHCFGCGVGGGLKKFQELVGERPTEAPHPERRPASPLAEARQAIVAKARRQPWSTQGFAYIYEVSDWVRTRRKGIDEMRRLATDCSRPGECEPCFEILYRAACMETLVYSVEAQHDELIAESRRP